MKNILIILLLSALMFSQTEKGNQVYLSIATEKQMYFLDEPIYIEVTQTNSSPDKQVWTRYCSILQSGDTKLEITSNTAEKMTPFGSATLVPADILLQPGESYKAVFLLNLYYGVKDDRPDTRISGSFLPKGQYTIRLIHTVNPDEKITVPMKLKSNSLMFTIVDLPEKHSEERSAFFSAYQSVWGKKQDELANFKETKKFLNTWPQSPFLPEVLWLYTSVLYDMVKESGTLPPGSLVFTPENILENYGNTFFIYDILPKAASLSALDLFNSRINEDRKMLLLKQRILDNAKYRKTRVAEYANSLFRNYKE